MSRAWDEEHDRNVARALLDAIRLEFTSSTWQAFESTARDRRPAAQPFRGVVDDGGRREFACGLIIDRFVPKRTPGFDMPPADDSFFLPPFLQKLADPAVKTVMLCGCGGGFDFVHSLLLYPELKRLGKSVVIGSYSFGNPHRITGDAETIFDRGGALAKRVTGSSRPDPYYGPEVHVPWHEDMRA